MKTKDKVSEILSELKKRYKKENIEGMQRYGIRFKEAYGVSVPFLRKYAKQFRNDHELALMLWEKKVHDAMIMAFLIDDYRKVSEEQMERWSKDFASWDIVDGCCSNLFDKTPFAYDKAFEWSRSSREFIKRAGFVLMAALAVHDKKADDERFIKFLPVIERESEDERNFVRKAVNWALRQIGKRNKRLYKEAIKTAERIKKSDNKTARWIASDALREFSSETTKRILGRREKALTEKSV